MGLYVWLIVPPVIYFTLAILSRFNIGIRHLLPIYPFLFVWIAGYASEPWRKGSGKKRAGLVFLGLWYLWSSLSSYPHYLSYFNELVDGAKNGHKVLLDSNLDWGVAAHFEFGNLWARQGNLTRLRRTIAQF
ncbi:MAG: hypothetical protein ACREQO_00425 [Candidatus Binatia bacterium]